MSICSERAETALTSSGAGGEWMTLIELVGGWSGGEVGIETVDVPLFAAARAVHQDYVGHEVELVGKFGR